MTSRAAPLAVGVPKPLTKQVERDRVLSDDEISSLWKACEEIGWPFGPVFQLLLLTAQRKNGVAGMRWSELDLDNRVWHLPKERTKNGKAHDVSLSEVRGFSKLPPKNARASRPDRSARGTRGGCRTAGRHPRRHAKSNLFAARRRPVRVPRDRRRSPSRPARRALAPLVELGLE